MVPVLGLTHPDRNRYDHTGTVPVLLLRSLERLLHCSSSRACDVVSSLPVLLTHPDRNTQNERRATQSNTRQRTQGKQNQRSRNNTSKPKTEHRGSRTLLETTNDRKPKPTHQPQAAPIETTTRGLPQPHRPSQPNLPRTTLDPTRHPRQHRTRTSNVQAPHGITPCGVCARYSAA